MNDTGRTTAIMLIEWLDAFGDELSTVNSALATRLELGDSVIDLCFNMILRLTDEVAQQRADAIRNLTEGT